MNTEQKDTSMTLIDLINILKTNFVFISSLIILGFILSVTYSLVVTPIYSSTALIAPKSNNSDSVSGSSLSNLAGLSGLMPLSTGARRTEVAYQKLMSREFFKVLYDNDEYIRDFYAISSYDTKTKEVFYTNVEGLRVKNHFQKSYEDFHKDFFVAYYDRKNGLVDLLLKNESAELASLWLEKIIFEINDHVKKEEKLEAENSLNYLKERLGETNAIEVKRVIAALIRNKIQTLMLAEVSEEYLFEVIDRPFVPDYRFWPKRTQLTVIGTICFGLIAIMLSLFAFLKNKSTFTSYLRSTSLYIRLIRRQNEEKTSI